MQKTKARTKARNKKQFDPLAVSKPANIGLNIYLIFLTISAILPFVFVFIISITDESYLAVNGYSLFPKELSLDAYKMVFSSGSSILNAYKVSIFITVVGVILALILTTLYAYALSRQDFEFKGFFTKVSTIPMLFSGGLVAGYLVMTQVLGLKDSIWALILPMLLGTFNIIIMRTFFQTSIPKALIEAATIDGANEFQIFFKIVLPLSLPVLATVGLFLTLGYWNDWYNAMLYIDDLDKIPVQYLLIRIQNSTSFLSSRGGQIGGVAAQAMKTLPKETLRMAIVVITTAPIAITYPFFQRYFISGLTLGAVKE
ncbi:MAG: carbohydrate ABC transporter permease [Anaerococcus sp.]|uniref:carbohydrate ABC transporter permease n=1 Tax=Anaerococcus sp. AGMB09787 TaxID=2922869 RepID=UPI001FAF200F|nr:carbohydrate ABC transporter permease [Anaerococcus sp. AGMB09787]MDD7044762.1 carbohydrate ABC transporter permease [Peptoniphilaceae bacterium]MDY2919489.1 carbohydrate ABC transporter permease [Anaerococcus sp.]